MKKAITYEKGTSHMKRGLLLFIAGLLIPASMFAQEKTLNVYKSDLKVQRFALENIDSIGFDEPDGHMLVYKKDGTLSSIKMAEVDSMNYSSGEYALP